MINFKIISTDGSEDFLNYQMQVTIKNDKNLEILDSRFEFSDVKVKKLIYTHTEDESLLVCMTSNVEVYSIIKIDVVLSVPDFSPETSDFYAMENAVNKARQMYADFNTKVTNFDELERKAIDENIKVNSKIIRTSFLQMIILVFMGVLQYIILRFAIKRIKKE